MKKTQLLNYECEQNSSWLSVIIVVRLTSIHSRYLFKPVWNSNAKATFSNRSYNLDQLGRWPKIINYICRCKAGLTTCAVGYYWPCCVGWLRIDLNKLSTKKKNGEPNVGFGFVKGFWFVLFPPAGGEFFYNQIIIKLEENHQNQRKGGLISVIPVRRGKIFTIKL